MSRLLVLVLVLLAVTFVVTLLLPTNSTSRDGVNLRERYGYDPPISEGPQQLTWKENGEVRIADGEVRSVHGVKYFYPYLAKSSAIVTIRWGVGAALLCGIVAHFATDSIRSRKQKTSNS